MLAPLKSPIPEVADGWLGQLDLQYGRRGTKTCVQHSHQGPLRILKSMYPEGNGVCHNVLVHPPSGLIGSDQIEIKVRVGEGAHGLLTTPGATRFLGRSRQWASQTVAMRLESDSRFEWLPLETLIYTGAWAKNRMHLALSAGSSLMTWDVYALGLQASSQPFLEGALDACSEWPGHWRDHAVIRAEDLVLLDGPLGLQGHRAWGQFVLLWDSITQLSKPSAIEDVLDETRRTIDHHIQSNDLMNAIKAGVSQSQPGVIQLRALANHASHILELFQVIWPKWRSQAWGMNSCPVRSWKL